MSQETKRIAVIGGGAFGTTTALRLAAVGHAVTVFERNHDILLGASKNNQNRLHLGYHYPRDLGTALQCKDGFARFSAMFPECISGGFPNRYFIAASGSRTSPEGYLRFLRAVELPYREVAVEHDPDVSGCALGVFCDEVVYDCETLRRSIRSRLRAASGLELRTDTHIIWISRDGDLFRLRTSTGATREFDAVVNCSYDEINRLTGQLGYPVTDHQFEYTVIPIIDLDIPRQGITVMDGPFMTLLPYGKTTSFLLYHVAHTVVATEHALVRDARWSDPGTAPFASMDKVAFFERMRDACSEFVPALRGAVLRGFLEGPRMVLAYREHDDARPSIVHDHGGGYLTVFAGKIDHCAGVADDVRGKLEARS